MLRTRRADSALATSEVKVKSVSSSVTELPPIFNSDIEQNIPSHTLLLSPTLVTQDFDALRFEAAAFNQLPVTTGLPSLTTTTSTEESDTKTSPLAPYSTLLISSPYNSPGHYLDLTTLSTPSLLFAKALTALQPIRPDYATAPYTESLNFSTVLTVLRNLLTTENTSWSSTSFYVVIFRSKLKKEIDKDLLYTLDFESHREACESGGLLKYWFGKTDGEDRNLATCFWHSRADAYKGGLGPWHKKARAAGRELYEKIVFSTHRFTVLDGAQGFRFEDWRE